MSLDTLCAGILVADHLCAPIARLPRPGELVVTEQLVLNIGGCAANTAMDLARLGVRVGVTGAIGGDIFGRFVAETLSAGGVDTAGLVRLDHVGTAGTLIVNVAGEDRRYIHSIGANAHFTAASIPLALVEQARVLYIGGFLLMPAMTGRALAEVFRHAKRHGVQTVLDVVIPGPGDHLSELADVLPETDLFLPNADEGIEITGCTDPILQAEAYRAAGAKTVVVTCGRQGSILISDDVRLKAGTYPVDYVDGTGAGDAFDAGYIAALLAGHDPANCLRFATALGASCVRAIGATAGVFNRAEAEAFVKRERLAMEEI